MILGQILQLIVRKIRAQPDSRQHTDVPVLHSLATGIGATVAVDVGGDECDNLIGKFAVGIHELQCSKNGNDAVPRFQIQLLED